MNPQNTPPIVRVNPGATGASSTSNILPIASKTMPSVVPPQVTLVNHSQEDDELARLCLKRVLADPILCAQLFPEEFSPKGFSIFPKNAQDWLQKEEVVLSNEDLIGPRWTILWSRFIKPIALKDSSGEERQFSSGFQVLQSVDHVGNDLIYPFSSLKSLLDKDDFNTYNSDQIANFVKVWSKILIFVVTGNFSRHPWFDTSSLHGFCNQAAASLPSLCEQYSNLVAANREILALKKKYPNEVDPEAFSAEAEECIKKQPQLFLLRPKININRDSMFRHSDLGLFIYERITKELEEPKLWWPIQLLTKAKADQLSEDIRGRVVSKGMHRRSKKSRSLSMGGSLTNEDVWYQRLPKTAKVPDHKKEFCANFESTGKAQHEEDWLEWLKLQDM